MDAKKEKWKDDILGSMEGMQKATPRADLFSAVEQRVYASSAKIVPINRVRMAAAAAILLLIMNVFSIRYFLENREVDTTESALYQENASLISNYQLYE